MLAHAIATTSPDAWFAMFGLFVLVFASVLWVATIENNNDRPRRRKRR